MVIDPGRIALSLGVLLIAGLVAQAASAHDFDERHRCIVTVHGSPNAPKADVLLLLDIPGGPRADLLRSQFDLDKDERLSRMEALFVAEHLGAETVGGYVLRMNHRAIPPRNIHGSAVWTDNGGVAVAILLNYSLGMLVGAGTRLSVQVLATPGGDSPLRSRPLTCELQVEPPLSLLASSHPVAPDAPVVGPIEIEPGGDEAWVQVGRPGAVRSP